MPTQGRKLMKEHECRRRAETVAARMPEELFERILGPMGVRWRDSDKGVVEYSKAELGQCALVSKYWARRCQAMIFREIRLDSARDVRDLFAMLDRPDTKIAQYIQEVQIADLGMGMGGAPWWHLVPLLYRRLQLSSRHSLDKWAYGSSKPRTVPRTIHPYLPRTMPAHNTRLHRLELAGTSFACFGDFIHLLDELRDLRILKCRWVTWAKGPPLTHLRSTKPRSACLDRIDLYNRTFDEYTLWLLSAYRASPDTLHLNATNKTFATTLCAFFVSTIAEKADPHEHRWEVLRDSGQIAIRHSHDRAHTAPVLIWSSPCVVGETFSSANVHPPSLALDFTGDFLSFDAALRGDWQSFGAILSSLPGIHKLTLGFKTIDDMSRFMEEVLETCMTHLRTKVEYRCAIFHHTESYFDIVTRAEGCKTYFVSAGSKEAADARPKLLTEF